jgi:hypothetical protein
LLTLLALFGPGPDARADGGHIALHATSGPYTVTLFTLPEPLVAGPADLSLLVQDAATGAVLGDASAEGSLALTGGAATQTTFTLGHQAATNPLLLAGTVSFAQPGSYALTLRVTRGRAAPEIFATVLPVGANHRRRTTLIFALLLPLAMIALFLVNQASKQKARRTDTSPGSR